MYLSHVGGRNKSDLFDEMFEVETQTISWYNLNLNYFFIQK